MLPVLKGFDPLYYFDVDITLLSREESAALRQELNAALGEYILLKFSKNLTDGQLSVLIKIKNPQEFITTLMSYIPNYEDKVLIEIENFKKEFKTIGGLR